MLSLVACQDTYPLDRMLDRATARKAQAEVRLGPSHQHVVLLHIPVFTPAKRFDFRPSFARSADHANRKRVRSSPPHSLSPFWINLETMSLSVGSSGPGAATPSAFVSIRS